MDVDTIFPPLPHGEQVVSKYRQSKFCKGLETIYILTTFRLLIRWKETYCCCLHQSQYSSIPLRSISRIDETRPNRFYFITYIFLLLSSISALIIGLVLEEKAIWIPGLVALFVNIALAAQYCLYLRKKFISVKGDFGSVSLTLPKSQAREFEAKISELHHMIKMRHVNVQNIPQSPPSVYNVEREMTSYSVAKKKYRRDEKLQSEF